MSQKRSHYETTTKTKTTKDELDELKKAIEKNRWEDARQRGSQIIN